MHSLWRTYLDNLRDIVSREIPRVSSCDTWTMLRHDRGRRDRTRPVCAILRLSGCAGTRETKLCTTWRLHVPTQRPSPRLCHAIAELEQDTGLNLLSILGYLQSANPVYLVMYSTSRAEP
jgi:hypothetical protein